jgi:hypothetical protein
MNANTISKQTEIKLLNFFNDRIDPVEMAKTLRQVNFTLALCVLSEHETFQSEIIKLRDSFYWLNEFGGGVKKLSEKSSIFNRGSYLLLTN